MQHQQVNFKEKKDQFGEMKHTLTCHEQFIVSTQKQKLEKMITKRQKIQEALEIKKQSPTKR